jgi:hypothetical protein
MPPPHKYALDLNVSDPRPRTADTLLHVWLLEKAVARARQRNVKTSSSVAGRRSSITGAQRFADPGTRIVIIRYYCNTNTPIMRVVVTALRNTPPPEHNWNVYTFMCTHNIHVHYCARVYVFNGAIRHHRTRYS